MRDAYLVAYAFPAPLMVRVADDMLADLRADVGSRRTDRILGTRALSRPVSAIIRRFSTD